MTPGVRYAVWPSGMPEAARFCDHPGTLLIVQTAMAMAVMGAFGVPPRIRIAERVGARPDPHEIDGEGKTVG